MFDNRRIISILAILLFSALVLKAQTKTDSSNIKTALHIDFFNENNLGYGNRSIRDSITYKLDSFQIAHPFLLSTGNLGAPGKYLTFQSSIAEPFSVRPDVFGYFGFNRYNRKFYSTNKPYTLLQYFVGQRREQFVDVIHSRNFGDNLNFTFHFIRARSEGFYKRQNTSNTSVRSNIWYMSPGKRYSLMADVFWTGENVAENGGIANDSSFEFSNQIDRQVVAVNLENAGTIQRKRGVWMKHTFAFGDVTDTLKLDSSRVCQVITPKWGLSLVSELFDEKYNYNDGFPQSIFYDVIYRDTLLTADSTYCWRINNSVRLERFNQYGKKSVRGYVGIRHEDGEYFNDTLYRHFQNVYAEGTVEWIPLNDSSVRLAGNAWVVGTGTNAGDYFAQLSGSRVHFNGKLTTTLKGWMSETSPAMLFQGYSGNHLRWVNSFAKTANAGWEVQANLLLNSIVSKIALIGHSDYAIDPLYFDSTFLPQQYHGRIATGAITLLFNIDADWFHSCSGITNAWTSNDEIIRIPQFIARESVYANLRLFKNAMQLQVGIDATWFSEFTAEAYMPAVAQFYLQNQRKVGNYVYIDPWVSFRIKPVRVFVKAEHINAGLMGRKYFLLDGYPHNDFALKVGISWLFSD